MKLALKISLLVNLSLLASLVFVWMNRPEQAFPPMNPVGSKIDALAPAIAIAQPPVMSLASQPHFDWSQLTSADYRAYVKNLRGIGCPEATLRAIVTADVNRKYGARSEELGRKLEDFDRLSWSEKLSLLNSRETWLEELRQIPGEKAAEIASLLGLQRAPANDVVSAANLAALSPARPRANATASLFQADATTPVPSPDTFSLLQANAAAASPAEGTSRSQLFQSRHPSPVTPVYPMVFQKVDLAALNLNEQQIQAINDLRQTFVDEIGGLDQDPSSPDYLQRWLKAQTDVDNLAKGMLGIMPWQTYQIAIRNQSQP